jgi:hypothetical protein
VGDIDDTRLDVGGRVEHLARHITGRGDDNEPIVQRVNIRRMLFSFFPERFPFFPSGVNLLVEDGNTAQRTAQPFRIVLLEFRVHRLKERADERHLPRRANDRSFVPYVGDWKATGSAQFSGSGEAPEPAGMQNIH